LRVLVVSEDADERQRAVSALPADVEVTEADDVEAARHLARSERFDVIVVDGDLRPRGGFAMLYDLRRRHDLDGDDPVPALVMISREQDRWLAGWAGANEAVPKPVDSFDLADRVMRLEGAEVPPYGDAGSAAAQVAGVVGRRS